MTFDEVKDNLDNIDIFELYEWKENNRHKVFFNEDEVEKIYKKKLLDSIYEVTQNPRVLEHEYEGLLKDIILLNIPKAISNLLKINVNIEKIIKFSDFKFELVDIMELSDEEKNEFIDKLGGYLSLGIQETLIPSKSRKEKIAEKKEKISKLKEIYNSSDFISTQIEGMNDEEKLEILSLEKLNNKELTKIIQTMSEENKMKAIELFEQRIYPYQIAVLAEGMTDENKLKVINNSLRRLNGEILSQIANGMHEENKLSVIKMGIEAGILEGQDIVLMARKMAKENLVKIIEMGGEVLIGSDIVSMVKELEEDTKLEAIRIGAEKSLLYGENIVSIMSGTSEAVKIRAINIGLECKILEGRHIKEITVGMGEKSKLRIIKSGIHKLDGYDLAWILEGMNDEAVLEVIELGLGSKKLKSTNIVEIARRMSEDHILEVINMGIDILETSDICSLSRHLSEDKEKEIIRCLFKKRRGKFVEFGIEKNIHYMEDMPDITEGLIEALSGNPLKEEVVDLFKKGKIGFKTAFQITTEKELKFCDIYGELYDVDKIGLNTLPTEKIEQLNKKHIKQIMSQLKSLGVEEGARAATAVYIYCVFGYHKSMEILEERYGYIDRNQIKKIFKNINLSELILNNGEPELNSEIINLVLGQNRNVQTKSSLLKRYLKDGYPEEVCTFFEKFGIIYSEWDRINEELDRKKAISKLRIERNAKAIVETVSIIESQEIIPEELSDYKLLRTDVHEYIGRDTQYTVNPEKALARAYYLSRLQEGCKTKKFPEVRVEDSDSGFVCSTYSPQDREIMTAGHKTGCCFRPNGAADGDGKDDKSLMKYCLTSEYAGGIKIEAPNTKTGNTEFLMFSPILRNGNMLMIHSIETKETDPKILKMINNLLKQYAIEVLERSREAEGNDGIQAVLITDLHNFDVDMSEGRINRRNCFFAHEDAPKTMYTDFSNSHIHILATNGQISQSDFVTGDVSYSYEFSSLDEKLAIVYSKSEREFIKEYEKSRKEIIRLANERKKFYEKGRIDEAEMCLKSIKHLKKEMSSLRKKCKNGLKALDNQRKQKILIDSVLKKVAKTGEQAVQLDEEVFSRIIVGEEYFVVITENQEIVAESTDQGRETMEKDIEQIRDFCGGNNITVITYEDYISRREKNKTSKNAKNIHDIVYEGGSTYHH